MQRTAWILALSILFSASAAGAQVRFVEGEFLGDGSSSRSITGLGFRPDVVLVVGESGEPALLRSATMGPALAKPMGPGDPLLPDRIQSLDADGFTVGSDATVNSSDTPYHWIALRGSAGLLHIGSYTGNGVDARVIDVGFAPDYVIVMAENNDQAMQRFVEQVGDASLPFDNTDAKPDRIQGFTASGFEVGKHNSVNEDGRDYHWIAFAPSTVTHETGSFVGDESAGRVIGGLPFGPESVLIKANSGAEGNALRTATMVGDYAMSIHEGVRYPDSITDLLSDGFVVGPEKVSNESNKTIHWVAFRDTPQSDLAVSGTVGEAVPAEGDTVRFDVDVENLGPADATGVVLNSTLSSGLTPLFGSPTAGSYDAGTRRWNLGDLPMGVSERLRLWALVEGGTAGRRLDLVSKVATLDRIDPVAVNDSLRVGVDVADTADVALDLSVNPAVVDEGEEFEILAQVENLGPARANGVAVDIDVPALLDYVTDSPDVGFFDSGTGVWDVGALDPGTRVSLRLGLRPGAGSAGSDLSITGTVATENPDPVVSNDSNSTSVRVRAADLSVTVTPSQPTANLGEEITWTIEVINAGPDDASGVEATVTPSLLLLESGYSATQGSYSSLTDIWSIGAVAAGDTVRLTLDTLALAGSAGSLLKVDAEVRSSSVDPVPDNDTAVGVLSVLSADLGVLLTADRSATNPGELVTYTVTLTNAGPDSASQAEVLVALPAGLNLESWVADQGSYDEPSGLWSVGNLLDGDLQELELQVRPDAVTAGTDLTVTASASSIESDLVSNNDSDSHVLDVLAIDLALTKTVSNVAPDEGQVVTYTVTVENLGPDSATGVEVTDALPSELTFVSAVPSRGTYDAGTGVWSIGGVLPGEFVTLALIVTVNTGTAGAVVVNQAGVSASGELDLDPTNDEDTASLTVFSADLSLSQVVDIVSPNEGDTITFTLDVENLGPNDVTGVQVSSPVIPGLSYVGSTAGQGSYDSGTGIWSVGGLTAGQAVSLELVVQVDVGTAGAALTQLSTILTSSLSDPVPENDTAQTTLTIFSTDLWAQVVVDEPRPSEGDTVTFTVTLGNDGPNLASGVVLAESLATDLTLSSSVPSVGSFDSGAGLWSLASLASGATETLTIEATVDSATAGRTLLNTFAILGSDLVDPDPTNDRAAIELDVRASDLELDLSAMPILANAGATVEWSVTLRNAGPDSLAETVVDVAPGGSLVITGWSSSQGSFDPGTGLWRPDGLPVDSTATLWVSTTVGDAPAGSTIMTATQVISSIPADPDPTDNLAATSIRIASADLVVAKHVDRAVAELGDAVSFTIDVANRGPDAATSVAVLDTLPAGLSPTGFSTSAGVYDPVTGRWTLDDLGAGTSATLSLQAAVDMGTSGQILTNTARIVEVDEADPIDIDILDEASVVVRTADLALTAESSAAPVALGDTTAVTFRLKNRGPGAATAVSILLSFDEGVVPLQFDADGDWDVGPSIWSLPVLASGATATLGFDVQVVPTEQKAPRGVDASVVGQDQFDPEPSNDSARAEFGVLPPVGGLQVRFEQFGVSLIPGATPVDVMSVSIQNTKILPDTLVGLVVKDASAVKAGLSEIDGSWQALRLSNDRMQSFATSAPMQGGRAVFGGLRLGIPPGETLQLVLHGGASLMARDGDALDVDIDAGQGLSFDSGDTARTQSDSETSAVFPVDGMSADQIRMVRLDAEGLATGVARQEVLQCVLPPNGYEADELQKLNLVQYGTARASSGGESLEIAGLEAWADDGSGDFDPTLDTKLGSFSYTGDRWELTGLSHPVELGGLRVFVSADIEAGAEIGRTVQLGLPGPPDPGVGMASDNDGPVDRAPESAALRSIIALDRITVAANAGNPGPVAPGSNAVRLLDLVLSNSYSTDRTLRRLEIENASVGPGSQAQLDAALELLTLRLDGNGDGDLDDINVDPVLGSGALIDSTIVFDGLSLNVPANQSLGLFVQTRISSSAADADVLQLQVAGPSSVDFEESSSVSGSWPVSGDRRVVDGMVAAQVALGDLGSETLGALEGPALVLDLGIPPNGYQSDVLRGLRVGNTGTATSADLAELRLWRDGGDERFDAGGGDDFDLGPFSPMGEIWQSTSLGEALDGGTAPRFFVSASVSDAPTDSVTLQLEIPIDGITVESGNDGPVDAPLLAPRSRLLSSAPLLVSVEFDRSTSVISDAVEARMILRNVGADSILGIEPEDLEWTVPGVLRAESGPVPAGLDLAAGESDTVRWSLRADGPGTVQFQASAAGTSASEGLERRALPSTSGPHEVFVEATLLALHPVPAAPSTVSPGQENIVPFTLTFDHDAGAEVSDVEVETLRLRFEDELLVPVDVQDLLAWVRVSEGTNEYVTMTSFATGDSTVELDFEPPIRVTTSEPVTVSVQLALSAVTSASDFHVTLEGPGAVGVRDANSGAAVSLVLQSGAYPLRSGLATIRAEVTELRLDRVPFSPPRVPPAATGVPLLTLRGENPGVGELTADVEVEQLEVEFLDAAGEGIASAASLLSRLRIVSGTVVAAESVVDAASDSVVVLQLSPRIRIPVGSPVDLRVEADLAPDLAPTSFRVRVWSTGVKAVDSASREAVPIVASADPLVGEVVTIEYSATEVRVASMGGLPPVTIIGETEVSALRFDLRHPGGEGTGRVRLDSLEVALRDELRAPVDLSTTVDRLVLLREGAPLVSVTDFSQVADRVVLPLPVVELDAGEVAAFTLQIDVEASAPDSFFELWIPSGSMRMADANTAVAVDLVPEPGVELPLVSGLSRLRAPARAINVSLQSHAPAVIVPGEKAVDFATLQLSNAASQDATPIDIEAIELRLLDAQERPIAASAAAQVVRLLVEGAVVAQSNVDALDSSAVHLTIEPPLRVAAGSSESILLQTDLASVVGVSGIIWEIGEGGVTVTQPQSALLSIDVVPAAGSSFPLRTESSNLSVAGLEDSFSNFPNPFAAGRRSTTFVYHLSEDADVTLRIFTLIGERVITLLDGQRRSAGLHQDDAWDGRNGKGDVVRNGVYLARIEARYADGSTRDVMRKVAVRR